MKGLYCTQSSTVWIMLGAPFWKNSFMKSSTLIFDETTSLGSYRHAICNVFLVMLPLGSHDSQMYTSLESWDSPVMNTAGNQPKSLSKNSCWFKNHQSPDFPVCPSLKSHFEYLGVIFTIIWRAHHTLYRDYCSEIEL
jgi:hypothetical protein